MQPLNPKPPEGSESLAEFLRIHAIEVSGSLCVFGDWFGRPMDNWHALTGYEIKGDYLKFSFDEGETLEVWRPAEPRMEGKRFVIQHADRVRWEWFYHGRPKLPENRFFIEHWAKDGVVQTASNVTWDSPDSRPSLTQAAVSIQ